MAAGGLSGFDPEFSDLPDYIYKITARIWEGRQVGAIHDYYSKGCPVRSPTGVVVGTDEVAAATLATMAEFPDRRLLGEDVIWKPVGDDAYLSSHRILSHGTHGGDGAFGRATGKSVRYHVIADCLCRGNQVVEEWLVRDQGAVAACLGMGARELAATQAQNGDDGYYTADTDKTKSGYEPELADDADAQAFARMWQDVWGRSELACVAGLHHHAAILRGPGGREWVGKEGATRFFAAYAAAVANPELTVDDLTVRDTGRGKTVAMRWSVRGTCAGAGILAGGGRGKQVHVMGISHARFVDGRVLEHWCLVDEVALWKQVL